MSGGRGRRGATLLLGLWCVACAAAVTWPVFAWVDARVDADVLGLPFPLAWVTGWVCASFGGLGLYHLTGDERE